MGYEVEKDFKQYIIEQLGRQVDIEGIGQPYNLKVPSQSSYTLSYIHSSAEQVQSCCAILLLCTHISSLCIRKDIRTKRLISIPLLYNYYIYCNNRNNPLHVGSRHLTRRKNLGNKANVYTSILTENEMLVERLQTNRVKRVRVRAYVCLSLRL